MTLDISSNIGKTPLVEIKNLNENKNVKVYAKVEWQNLSGSIKDRAAWSMIGEAEKTGQLTKDKIILESTSGNTGIALAVISRLRGYKIKLVMPANVSEERKNLLQELGAKLILTDPLLGPDGAYDESNKIFRENEEAYYKPDQYCNPANPEAHYTTTAEEIWDQTSGKITHFIAGTGTSGTLMGVGKKLKEKNKNIQILSAEPEEELHGVEGLKNMRIEMVPKIYDETLIDEKIYVKTDDAYDTAKKLARRERLFAGLSSGLNISATLGIAKTLEEGTLVTVLPDSGYRYLSNNVFPDDIFDVKIKKTDLERLKQHTRGAYPNECCGLLAGRVKDNVKIITKTIPVNNKNEQLGHDRYEIDPAEYLNVDKTLDDNERIIGVYHSHPDHPPRPSERDLTKAHPEYSYIILATVGEVVTAATSWRINEEENEFTEEFVKIH